MSTEEFRSIDYHTAGEPFRIVTDLPVTVEGEDVPSKRTFAMNSPEVERIRQILCHEPRGHADMYGGFLVPPNDSGAHLGVLFWHKDGFSTACGHGTIALGAWAIESGLVAADPSGTTEVVIDVPSGRVTARVHTNTQAEVTEVDFVNVDSYLLAEDVTVETSLGPVAVDIGFGGAIYAQLDAGRLALEVAPEQVDAIIAIGREVKWALNDTEYAVHPLDERLSGIYGTIIYENLPVIGDEGLRQRNATVFADGELDRSPCGSGTCARVATVTAQGKLPLGSVLQHGSIVGSQFRARVIDTTETADRKVVTPQVTGTAHKTGEHLFVVDGRDDLIPGFVLR